MTPEVVSPETWADHVAGLLADRLAARPRLVVCLPTGSTPLPAYDRLPGVLADRGISTGGSTAVGLDEFIGLPTGHPARCDAVLRRRLLDRLEPGPRRFVSFAVDESGGGAEAACEAFDRDIVELGGIDLVVLGLGANGHIGMNEPGSEADAPTRVVELAPSTRAAAIGYGADPPPTHGLTLGMAGILAAREIWLLATGPGKAGIVARTLIGPAGPDVPASLLRGHAGLRIILDGPAAAGLRH